VTCVWDAGSNQWYGTGSIDSECGDGGTYNGSDCAAGGGYLNRVDVCVIRSGCRWEVSASVRNNNACELMGFFLGNTTVTEDCRTSAVANNTISRGCYPSGTIGGVGSCGFNDAIGSNGIATVTPC
jgi:hypothetical protein